VTTLKGPLDVMSDSTYVVNCFRDRWWERWVANGWVTSGKKPVANRDLWQPLIEAYQADPARVRFHWVKGHSTDPMNDLVDRLAVEAAVTQKGREGTGRPEHLGPADVPKARREYNKAGKDSAAPDGPSGHLVAITGLKPPGLGGYEDNPTAVRVKRRLAEILTAKRALHPDVTVLTGLGLGAEQLGAEAAATAGVPYVAVLAFPGVEEVWPRESRQRFEKLRAGAADTTTLQRNKPDSKQAAGGALARRDAWMARHADEAIVVWDRDDAAVGRTVRSLQDHLGEEDVWVLEP
jgi:uncharacterized phage-like protein YoqJ